MKFTSIAALVALTHANDQIAFLNDKAVQIDDQFSSSEYLASSAASKKDALWTKIIADRTSGSYPDALHLPGIMFEAMDPTFKTPGDQMPNSIWGSVRTKYIHSVGVVGKVKFVSSNSHPFTGVWEGSQHGLVRLSSAAQPNESQPLAPGMGLKFLRDGVDSADMVAMYRLEGNPVGEWNFFEKDFHNHVVSATTTKIKALVVKFLTETPWVQSVGLSNMGQWNEAGQETTPVFPFVMRFHPNKDVHTLIPNSKPDDFMAYTSQLEAVPADSVLYDVYGTDAPPSLGGVEHFMGTLQLDGQLTKSKWGDQELFYRHQLSSDDMALKPEWESHYAKDGGTASNGSTKSKCPYMEMLKGLYQ